MNLPSSFLKAIRSRFKHLALRLTPKSRRFHRIYRTFHWGANSESLSGAGSTLAATQAIRKELPDYLTVVKCQLLLDLGCGDFNWMRTLNLPCRYIGADIVDDLIEQNRRLYGDEERSFIVLDGTTDPFPAGIDVVLCREVLFHLSFKDASDLLSNVKASTAEVFIVTNMTGVEENTDTFTGGFRPIDLCLPPFSFPEPDYTIPDQGVAKNRYLCAWNVRDLP